MSVKIMDVFAFVSHFTFLEKTVSFYQRTKRALRLERNPAESDGINTMTKARCANPA